MKVCSSFDSCIIYHVSFAGRKKAEMVRSTNVRAKRGEYRYLLGRVEDALQRNRFAGQRASPYIDCEERR